MSDKDHQKRMLKDFDKLLTEVQSCGLDMHAEASGFHSVYCPICNKTEKRTGGFRFESDKIGYNCFRGSCDASCVYTFGEPMSRRFKRLMEAIGVKVPASLRMVKSSIQKAMEDVDNDLYVKNSYNKIDFPEGNMVTVTDDDSDLGAWWRRYLERRKIPMTGLRVCHSGQYRDCLMIPFWNDGKYVGCQFLTKAGVYLANYGGNEHLLYSPSGSFNMKTVILVEGAMDARCIPFGVATLGKKVTPEQAYHLIGKRVIMLPDIYGNHYIDQFQDYEWEICVPPWDVKDLNDAVKKYGLLVATRMVMDNLYKPSNPTKAIAAYKIWSQNGQKAKNSH